MLEGYHEAVSATHLPSADQPADAPVPGLLLFDVFLKNLRDLVCALLGVSLLSALVVDEGNAKSCRVAFGPLEVAVMHVLAQFT